MNRQKLFSVTRRSVHSSELQESAGSVEGKTQAHSKRTARIAAQNYMDTGVINAGNQLSSIAVLSGTLSLIY